MAEKTDAKKIVGFKYPVEEASYNARDLIIYSLGIGSNDLAFTYELHENFAAFPTYPVVLAFKGTSSDVLSFPPPSMMVFPDGMPSVNPAMILHGEQYLEVLRPLETEGKFKIQSRVIGFHDKGKGALQENETLMLNEAGEPVVKLVMGSFMRGVKGFESAGETYSKNYPAPSRAPDAVVEIKTSPDQALLYRLSGDYNPLHADPETATSVGFEKPILHGLCSFGIAARAVLSQFAGNDPTLFKAMKVRFASIVYPGETLVTEMWKEGNRIIFEVKVKERGTIAINNAYVDLHTKAKL
eukprot:TRINITY_DN16360_c0_g1_i1.p1 TRINITY_DN16360_c0_g1~~TRINITY_DN16360_c0_g1_i1.p1  ORF type:complete len:298 (-),score=69.14 TRINITY_DN16360_c0_g1_i1:34-927(-)